MFWWCNGCFTGTIQLLFSQMQGTVEVYNQEFPRVLPGYLSCSRQENLATVYDLTISCYRIHHPNQSLWLTESSHHVQCSDHPIHFNDDATATPRAPPSSRCIDFTKPSSLCSYTIRWMSKETETKGTKPRSEMEWQESSVDSGKENQQEKTPRHPFIRNLEIDISTC